MAEYSKIARGTVTTQASTPLVINLPFQPTLVKIQMNSSLANPNNGYIAEAYWDASMPQNTAIDKLFSITGTSPSTNYLTTSYQATNGISTFSRGLSASFGPQKQVVSSTKGDPTTFVVTNHGFATYDYVLFEGLYNTGGATGMPQMCGIPFVVTVVDANTFTVPWVSLGSNYTNLTSSPSGAYVKKILNPDLYFPGALFIHNLFADGNQLQVQTTTPHNLVVGSVVSFRIPRQWGSIQLNYNQDIPGATLYGTVTYVYNNAVVKININPSNINTFVTNVPVSQVPGLSFPQMITAGDINTSGGQQLRLGTIPTINGPSINGAFVNNTSQGFIVNPTLFNSAQQNLSWEAYYFDLTVNG
jgi:hypothetical protein